MEYKLVCPECGEDLVKVLINNLPYKKCPHGHYILRLGYEKGMW